MTIRFIDPEGVELMLETTLMNDDGAESRRETSADDLARVIQALTDVERRQLNVKLFGLGVRFVADEAALDGYRELGARAAAAEERAEALSVQLEAALWRVGCLVSAIGDSFDAGMYLDGDVRWEDAKAPLALALAQVQTVKVAPPLDIVIHCPNCATQHIDAPEPERGWTNPPHKSHLCHCCGVVWRPADVPTNGVAAVRTKGQADTWTAERAAAQGRLTALLRNAWAQVSAGQVTAAGEISMLTHEPGCMFLVGAAGSQCSCGVADRERERIRASVAADGAFGGLFEVPAGFDMSLGLGPQVPTSPQATCSCEWRWDPDLKVQVRHPNPRCLAHVESEATQVAKFRERVKRLETELLEPTQDAFTEVTIRHFGAEEAPESAGSVVNSADEPSVGWYWRWSFETDGTYWVGPHATREEAVKDAWENGGIERTVA